MTTKCPIATRLGQLAGAAAFFGSRCQNVADGSVELTAYKSYSIPADVLGAFAASHRNIWQCGHKVTPAPRPICANIGPLEELRLSGETMRELAIDYEIGEATIWRALRTYNAQDDAALEV